MERISTADRLKQLMRERNLRQVDILELCKPYCEKYGVRIEKNDLSAYVNGKYYPGQSRLAVLGLALDVSEAWLMGYDVKMQRNPPVDDETDVTDIVRRMLNLTPENRARILERLQVLEEEEAANAGDHG